MKPKPACGSAKTASWAAMMKSQARAISSPPPMHAPLTAAMTGVEQRAISEAGSEVNRADSVSDKLLRSTPAQKVGPSPVRTMHPMSPSESASLRLSESALRSAGLSALRASGRLRVRCATPLWVQLNSVFSITHRFLLRGPYHAFVYATSVVCRQDRVRGEKAPGISDRGPELGMCWAPSSFRYNQCI